MTELPLTSVALLASLVALFVAIRNYRRKAGIFVRGSFSIASSRNCNDRYVSHVTLENQKDRAITVFGIYLRVGHGYYIELDNFEDAPLALKAYEPYHKDYGPIEFYSVKTDRPEPPIRERSRQKAAGAFNGRR